MEGNWYGCMNVGWMMRMGGWYVLKFGIDLLEFGVLLGMM